MNDELNQHREAIALGMEAKRFMESTVGQFLLGCAELKIAEAVESLKVCDPENSKRIRELQNEISVANSIVEWLEQVITNAYSEETILEERLA